MVNYTVAFWNRLNYNQKRTLYRLVNDVAINPSERFLNQWWFSLTLFKRQSIIEDLVSIKELLNENSCQS